MPVTCQSLAFCPSNAYSGSLHPSDSSAVCRLPEAGGKSQAMATLALAMQAFEVT